MLQTLISSFRYDVYLSSLLQWISHTCGNGTAPTCAGAGAGPVRERHVYGAPKAGQPLAHRRQDPVAPAAHNPQQFQAEQIRGAPCQVIVLVPGLPVAGQGAPVQL